MYNDDAYTGFAEVYDLFMDDVPYAQWADRVTGLLREHGITDGLILELGCGTGTFTELLAKAGYDMIGVDNSAEMLEVAAEKREASGADILYLLQDMREFELYGTVRAVVSVCDSMNYLTCEADLKKVFSLVNNYLDPGGLFLFDMKTEHYFRDIMGDGIFADNRPEGSFLWDNSWYDQEKINEYDLTLFVRRQGSLYEKRQETHVQRAYDISEIKTLLEEAGLKFETVYDAGSLEPPREDSERLYFLARETGKHI